tara:strand:- start:1041 stop:1754 length:714 start_codon:yes stop_codon:yes gene_type:complete
MLCIHDGGLRVPYSAVKAVKPPKRTQTYEPVPHEELVEKIIERFGDHGLEVESQDFGLACHGQRLFGVIGFQGEGNLRPVVGLRNSYDKSMSVGIATGARVFVCDNLAFSGESFHKLRKHTKNVHKDLDDMLTKGAMSCGLDFAITEEELNQLGEVELGEDRAYALLGMLFGRGGITSTQFSASAREWEKPSHDEFADRNLWSWYNAVNTSLKRSAPHRALEQYAMLHKFALEVAEA